MVTVTLNELAQIAPGGKRSILAGIASSINRHLSDYGIDTPLRVAHFLAQAAHETAGFTTLVEFGKQEYFDKYQGRKDLGNLQPGDGRKYKGRGIFQLTGRINYEAYGRRLGLDLAGNPELASDPDVSIRIACEYWRVKGLNAWADRDDIVQITRKINGGTNGLADRQRYLERAKRAFPDMRPVALYEPQPDSVPAEEVPDAPIASEPAKDMVQSKTMWSSGGIIGAIGTALYSIWDKLTGNAGIVFMVCITIIVCLVLVIMRERIKKLAEEKFG